MTHREPREINRLQPTASIEAIVLRVNDNTSAIADMQVEIDDLRESRTKMVALVIAGSALLQGSPAALKLLSVLMNAGGH